MNRSLWICSSSETDRSQFTGNYRWDQSDDRRGKGTSLLLKMSVIRRTINQTPNRFMFSIQIFAMTVRNMFSQITSCKITENNSERNQKNNKVGVKIQTTVPFMA